MIAPVQFFTNVGRKPSGALAIIILVILVIMAFLGPMIWIHDPLTINLNQALHPPSTSHPLGTDQYGRDMLARFIGGARISLIDGLVVAVLGAIVGTIIGMIAGYSGGLSDNSLMRFMDAILAFPPLMLAMAVAIALGGGGILSATIGIALATVPWFARIVRSRVLEVRELDFVEATRSLGGTDVYILINHILPHVFPIVLIQATVTFGYAILTIAALSFIGFGARPPIPEWGVMITEGQQYALSGQWWIPLTPGVGILLSVVAMNLLGDRMRDVLDPGFKEK